MSEKHGFRFRWTSIFFYAALCAIIAAGLIAIIALQEPTRQWLADFEENYEKNKPRNQIQRIFDEYFAEPDVNKLIELYGTEPEYNEPDTYEEAVERYTAKLRDKTMTYSFLAGTDMKAVNVKADGAVVARLYVKETGTKDYSALLFNFSQPVYELDRIELYYDKPVETVNVKIPERFTAYADGMELSGDYVTASGIKEDERNSVPEGAYLFTYKVCTVTGLYKMPQITVKDEAGNDVDLGYDEEKNLYSCKYEYSEELKEQYSEYVINALTKYAIYMQNDARFKTLKDYFDPASQLYQDIYDNPSPFVWEHDGYRFENEEASEFYDYGDVISCRVTFDHILVKKGKEDYIDKNDHTVYMHKVDGEYKIFYMVSH